MCYLIVTLPMSTNKNDNQYNSCVNLNFSAVTLAFDVGEKVRFSIMVLPGFSL